MLEPTIYSYEVTFQLKLFLVHLKPGGIGVQSCFLVSKTVLFE